MTLEPETVDYLLRLPAVASATSKQIRCTEEFRRRVVRGYGRGESPEAMFREAGLGPEIIGYKRIERAIARWRDQDPATMAPARSDAMCDFMDEAAPMGVVMAQQARINELSARLEQVTALLRGLGVGA